MEPTENQKLENGGPPLLLKSLREQVYEYLRDEMNRGTLTPGSTINLNEMSSRLGISKTPLRDALIQLECEGFVTISPRRGVTVNKLTIEDIRHAYEIAGVLEGVAIQSAFHNFGQGHIDKMERLNEEMRAAINTGDFDTYYRLNLSFHDVFLELSGNEMLRRIVMPIKQRLYDFPRRGYISDWELRNCEEHDAFIQCIKEGDREGAVKVMRDQHWSFPAQENFVRSFYLQETAEVAG
ncbi:MAG TPA: GntR family transcriptional regulator [Syntrophobacteria bacterium]|nr:GntR family transcriptional regulator [Syntrophobacteria bacterium]